MKKLILKTALLACVAIAGNAQALPVAGQGTWETTLLGRDINGYAVAGSDASAVFLYDTVLDVTWLRDANANGVMNWTQANTWAANLVVGAYDDWRLPTLGPVNGTSFNYDFTNNGTSDYGYGATGAGWGTASEMGHLFYVALGNKGFCTPGAGGSSGCAGQSGSGLGNTGAFQNLQSDDAYWSGLSDDDYLSRGGYAPITGYAWRFRYFDGLQVPGYEKSNSLYALAVRPGDVLVPAVPEPETYALMLAGLAVVGAAARRRKAK